MSIVRRDDRPVLARGPRLPTLQRLVDRASGSNAVTVLINTFTSGEAVPGRMHRHGRWAAGGREERRRGDHQTGDPSRHQPPF